VDTTPEQELDDRKDKKKDKVRSAWISFAGRIVAQLVGAIATVSLGVMMLNRYDGPDREPPAALLRGEPSVTVIVISPASTPAGTIPAASALTPETAARHAEMARAIARAVSGALPPAE
jgi:hypothetical protein